MEEAAPTLLLAGSKQLLDLARAETSGAAEAYVTLAASVLSHGAGALPPATPGPGLGCVWIQGLGAVLRRRSRRVTKPVC